MPNFTASYSYPGLSNIFDVAVDSSVGIEPVSARVSCVNPSAQNPSADGTLVIGDGTTTVNLTGCAVVRSEYSPDGSYVSFTLHDRRRKWKEGHIDGAYNTRPNGDESTIENEKTPQQLAELLLDAMGETGYDASALPSDPRPEVEWKADTPARELAALCDLLGFVIGSDSNDNVVLAAAGSGAAPSINSNFLDSATTSYNQEPPPELLRMACGPTQYQMEFTLEPVGIEHTGEIKLIHELSYAPNPANTKHGGFGDQGDYFLDITSSNNGPNGEIIKDSDLAQQSVFKYYRIKELVGGTGPNNLNPHGWSTHFPSNDITSIKAFLPIYNKLNEFTTFAGSKVQKSAYCYGAFEDHRADFGLHVISDKVPWGFSVDGKKGLVIFSERVYQQQGSRSANDVQVDGGAGLNPGDRFAANINIICLCEIDHPILNSKFYYALSRPTGVSGGPPVVTNIRDEVKLRYNHFGQTSNKTAVDVELNYYLDQMADQYVQLPGRVEVYDGFHGVEKNGLVQSVSWSGGSNKPMQTRIGYNQQANPYRPDFKTSQREQARSRAQKDRINKAEKKAKEAESSNG